jgi:hypothetical protein
MAVTAAGHRNARRLLAVVQAILPPCRYVTTGYTEHVQQKGLASACCIVTGASTCTFTLAGTRRSLLRAAFLALPLRMHIPT